MSIVIPQNWWPSSYLTQRWRKDGKRTRNASGERTKSDNCCCIGGLGPPLSACLCSAANLPAAVQFTVSGFADTTGPYTNFNDNCICDTCELFDGTYVLDSINGTSGSSACTGGSFDSKCCC